MVMMMMKRWCWVACNDLVLMMMMRMKMIMMPMKMMPMKMTLMMMMMMKRWCWVARDDLVWRQRLETTFHVQVLIVRITQLQNITQSKTFKLFFSKEIHVNHYNIGN